MHEKVGHFFASVKNGQIISKDAFKVLKSGVIGSDKWNLPLVCFFFVLQKGFSVLSNNIINCRFDSIGFITSITQMGF